MAAGGNNQRLTSPSCNPLRLAKHAANDRSNFHYCKTFIYELWSTDLVRKQTLFFICRCQSTQILKTVKSQKSSFDKMFKNCVSGLEMPQMPNILFYQTFYKICCLQHICGNIFVASALKAPSKMLGTSGAKSCSSPSQGPLAPPSLGVWVERPFM